MHAAPDRFDQDTLTYLRDIDARSGAGAAGVFVRRSAGLFDGARSGWGLLIILGAFGLTAASGPCFGPGEWMTVQNLPALPYVQAVAAGFGVFFLLGGIARYTREPPQDEFGSFLFADGCHVWDVTPDRVRVDPLSDLRGVNGTHKHTDGTYTESVLRLAFTWGSRDLTFGSKPEAELFLMFLQTVTALRSSDDPTVRELAATSPGHLAAVALELIRDGGHGGPVSVPDPPTPRLAEDEAAPTEQGAGGVWVRGLAAAGTAGLAVLAFGYVDLYLLDEHLFVAVPADPAGAWGPHDAYLAAFPAGRHTAEVRDRRDDEVYARATADSTAQDSPSALRGYLAEPTNLRNRDDARGRIGVYYDRAVADLKARAADPAAARAIDRPLFDGILALLEAMKRADHPVVTVGFRARLDPEPSGAVKQLEQTNYDDLTNEFAELKAIALRQPGGSAILSRGEVFSPEQVARREQAILDRLRAAVRQAVKQDVLTLQPAPPDRPPVLEVGYHVRPSGQLYVSTVENRDLLGLGARRTVKGLIRGYNIDWAITVRPPGSDKAFGCEIASEPLNSLRYEPAPSDPAWALCAIVLYSGFHDMSGRLIRNFALDPGPSPNSFSFAAVATTRELTGEGRSPIAKSIADALRPRRLPTPASFRGAGRSVPTSAGSGPAAAPETARSPN